MNPRPLSQGSGLEVEVRRLATDDKVLVLGVRATAPLPYPQGHLYWQAGNRWHTLDSSAVHLGPVTGSAWARYALPAAAGEGSLVIFSPGHDSVVDGGPIALEPVPERTP
jgi:hypothetical protein